MLLKLARQLDALDEASLMALWSKYATLTSRFEPTKRWEEACIVFSLIQAKHWKNQLFNYSWQQKRMPPLKETGPGREKTLPGFKLEKIGEEDKDTDSACRILAFNKEAAGNPPRNGDGQ